MLWQDTADDLRRHGVSYARAAQQLATLPHTEQVVAGQELDPLETVPTPAVARLHELARQQADQHPGDGRISTLHYLLALAMLPTAASKLLGELGVRYETVVQRLTEEGARLVEADDWRPQELPVEGWEEFRVTDQQQEVIRGRSMLSTRSWGGWVSGSCSASATTTPNGHWCGSILASRVLTHRRCWIASLAARRNRRTFGQTCIRPPRRLPGITAT